jgi:ABC-2 type transport system permease protein
MSGSLQLYFGYLRASVRSQLQYRASFVMMTVGHFLVVGIEFAGVRMLFDHFGNLRGWSLAEVALLYGVANVSFAIAEGMGRGFDTFGAMVKSGDFDRLLLRPRSTAFQVAAQEVQLMRAGRLAQGLIVLSWGLSQLGFSWLDPRWLPIAAGIAGGIGVFYGLFILQATLAFWTVESLEVLNTVTYGGVETSQYPLSIYRDRFRQFFTFIVPLGCVNFLPVQAALHPTPAALIVWTVAPPAVGALFILAALRIWNFGVRHYRSTGS